MRIQADLHVHTVASGHAFSTVMEVARETARAGLRAVGISDHGPALPGGAHPYHFSALRFLPRVMEGVRILRGVEANLVNARGGLDLPNELLGRLDYAMVGYHDGCGLDAGNPRKNTRALIAAMQNPHVRVVTHPGNPGFPVEIPELVRAAKDLGVALELNNASFVAARSGSAPICLEIATQVARENGLVSLASDAHIASDVGRVDAAWKAASAAGIQPEQVVNRSLRGLLRFLRIEEVQ